MKIGLVFDDSLDRFDGVQQYITTIGDELSRLGHTVKYLVGETSPDNPRAKQIYSMSSTVSVRGNNNRLRTPLPTRASKIDQVLSEEKFDVIHVMAPYSPFMASRVMVRAAANSAVVASFHIAGSSKLHTIGTWLLAKLQWRSLAKVDKWLAVSAAAQAFAAKTFGLKIADISPNVTNVQSFLYPKKELSPAAGKKRIVFLGRLVERKGCEHLLRAFADMDSALREDAELLICGDGPLRVHLEAVAKELAIDEQTQFLGFIDEDFKASYLQSAELTVFPATGGESFGIVLIEAMATNRPVVLGGNNDGYATVLEGSPGLLFDPFNNQALADLMTKALSDQAFRKQALLWQEKALNAYDVKNVARSLVGHYEDAILKRKERLA